MPQKFLRLTATAVVLLVVISGSIRAGESWVGVRVFWKAGAVARVGQTQVDIRLVPYPATVEAVNGEWLKLGRAWVRKSDVRTLEQSFEYWSERVRANPNDAEGYRWRGYMWHEKGEIDKEIEDYTEAVRLNPKDEMSYNNRANAWQLKGEFDKAVDDYTAVIRINPKDAGAFSSRGNLWFTKGDLNKAIQDYTDAIQIDARLWFAYLGRGAVYHQQQDYDSALRDYDKSLESLPNYPAALANKAFLLSTCSAKHLRDPELSLSLAEKALAVDATNPYARAAKACALALAGDYRTAIALQRRAVENARYANDERCFGGAHATARIAAWQKGELWLDRPPVKVAP